MAKAEYGSIITDLQGSIGGLTFQHNGSGKIVRQRPSGRAIPSSSQSNQVSTFSSIAAAWRALSSSNKDNWVELASNNDVTNRWGETVTLSGYAMFQYVNGNRAVVGSSFLSSPPSWSVPSIPNVDSCVFSNATCSITFDNLTGYSDLYVVIFTSRPLWSPEFSNRSLYRLTRVRNEGGFGATTFSFTSQYESVHGIDLLKLTQYHALTSCYMAFVIDASVGLASSSVFCNDYSS